MGAVFLYHTGKSASPQKALELFNVCGFNSPTEISSGDWKIYVFPKLIGGQPNVVSGRGVTLVSVGTPLYKGRSCEQSLWALLEDEIQGKKILIEDLKGSYSLFFCCDNRIRILCDPLGSKHLFSDNEHSMISSSLLAIAQCMPSKLHVDKWAVYEKFLTGFIMAPRTIFSEIRQIDHEIRQSISQVHPEISFVDADFSMAKPAGKVRLSKKQCVQEQSDALQSCFDQLREAAKNGVDLGLSGGYDSRLVLAYLNSSCHESVHLHSHATESVHDKELAVARKMAEYVGLQCHVVPTKRLVHSEDIDRVLCMSVLFYDGRTSVAIGGCGEVYTADYRKASTEGCPLTLTGIGGELYRNVFSIGQKTVRFDQFLRKKVFDSALRGALSARQYQVLCDNLITRAANRLGILPHSRIPKSFAHRYYCEIMMPDGQGNALDAYNQVSYCVAPFLEPAIILKGYEGIPFHGTNGDFEVSLIKAKDAGLAALPSVYGYPLDKRPIKYRIKEFIRAFFPNDIWDKMAEILKTPSRGDSEACQDLEAVFLQSNLLREAIKDLYTMFPEIDFSKLKQNGNTVKRMIFIAMTLYMNRERIAQDA